eukprot:Amastigsp_a676935_20.p3 type:complete len:149 gc:universal Amastigsp_a676935_20:826-380(-)
MRERLGHDAHGACACAACWLAREEHCVCAGGRRRRRQLFVLGRGGGGAGADPRAHRRVRELSDGCRVPAELSADVHALRGGRSGGSGAAAHRDSDPVPLPRLLGAHQADRRRCALCTHDVAAVRANAARDAALPPRASRAEQPDGVLV